MMLKNTLLKIVQEQKAEISKKDEGIKREALKNIDTDIIYTTIISGIRRCGKSTLLRQIISKRKNYNYFNFEDPRAIDFELQDFEKLEEVFLEINGKTSYYFFDEIQNISGWERQIRKLHDNKACIFITGSNASLLSKELGTKLTGRYIIHELYPFSYQESLRLTKQKDSIKAFESYLNKGGFPDFLKYEKIEILQQIFKDIILKDIIVRYKLRDAKTIQELATYLISNAGKQVSYNKLKTQFGLGSANSIINYIKYFEDSYLMFTIPLFSYSLKQQIVNPKKIYAVDTGLATANSASFSEDKGRVLENFVYLTLRKKNKVYYFKKKKECDFILQNKDKIINAIQVCYELNEGNQAREIEGLTEALETLNLKEGMIITYNQEEKIEVNGKKISVLPVRKWLLS